MAGAPGIEDPLVNPEHGPGAPRVVLGVCGGIAAYKAVEVCRQLVDAGVHVTPVLTDEATRFVGAVTFSALASEPVQRSLWDEASPIPHTRLGQQADLVVVVPCHGAHPRPLHGRSLRRPPLRHPPGHPGAGARLPRHAHRNVGARLGAENLSTLERRGVEIIPPRVDGWPGATPAQAGWPIRA